MENVKPTILYVDDEPANLTVLSAAFRRYYNIFTAVSAREGIEILSSNQVDLIITDQRMPEMTGVQFLEAIIPTFPEPVRMILTGFSDIDAIIKAVNNGSVLRYIMKPWDVNELKQIIDIGIQIHKLEQDNHILYEKLKSEIEKQQRVIDLFKKYVPFDVVNQISNDTARVDRAQEAEVRIIAILFADIRNFTKLAETVDPKILVTYLNQYFSTMIDCVIKNEGTVYKFLGDGLVALFGAPVSSIYNQKNSVMCALDMLDALKIFNKEHGNEVKHKIKIGIGIASGETIVGRIVTEQFLSYMAIGHGVDLAFLVEDQTHELSDSILITEPVYLQVKNDVKGELNRTIEVGGKKENIYKVLSKISNK